MRENLDHWPFVLAAYAITMLATAAMVVWAWLSMRRAEARRDKARGK